jgi:hypothetical protein
VFAADEHQFLVPEFGGAGGIFGEVVVELDLAIEEARLSVLPLAYGIRGRFSHLAPFCGTTSVASDPQNDFYARAFSLKALPAHRLDENILNNTKTDCLASPFWPVICAIPAKISNRDLNNLLGQESIS